MNYYNEIDDYAADWLENLIAAGHLPEGMVDRRSIREVQASDLDGYDQCHFFAGIGGWSLALQLAGWPEDRPVWTGSCPCQPFSAAGKRKGVSDERHLWPEFHRLIAECRPPVVLGEQVASKDGRLWLAGVRADLEVLEYGVVAADLCAAGVGAPHIRQRLWWVAQSESGGREERSLYGLGRVANAKPQFHRSGNVRARRGIESPNSSNAGRLADALPAGRAERRTVAGNGSSAGSSSISGLGDTDDEGLQGRDELRHRAGERSPWEAGWIGCSDGKQRRAQPGIFPLAHGVPNRVGRLRAYGNAIVPQVAAEFVLAFEEARVPILAGAAPRA